MDYNVNMMADSTSRWAEALHEISGCLINVVKVVPSICILKFNREYQANICNIKVFKKLLRHSSTSNDAAVPIFKMSCSMRLYLCLEGHYVKICLGQLLRM